MAGSGLDKDLIQFADWFDQHLKKTEDSRSGVASSSRPDLRFDRIVIDNHGPKNPWVKIVGDLDGDGLKDVVIGGQDGPLVWYRNPTWAKSVIAPGRLFHRRWRGGRCRWRRRPGSGPRWRGLVREPQTEG